MEKNNYNFLDMTSSDLDYIKNNFIDFDNSWNYDILSEEFNSTFSKYIVVKNKDNIIIAFAGIKKILDEVELMNIVVNKHFRNQYIASSLLEYLISYCQKDNVHIFNLEVNIKNSIAIKLYKKYNFIEVGLRKKYYKNTDDAILMSLDLRKKQTIR